MAIPESELQALFMHTITGLKISMKNIMKDKALSLSPLYFMLLKTIHDTENCTANYLADATERDKGQITRLVKEMMQQGLVQKQPNPHDKRSQFLQLTESGLGCFEQLAIADQAVLKEMRANVSDDELTTFLEIGNKMLQNLHKINGKP
ncbi:MAG: MarR family winged helix-turn-helix transcriptional regulator [Marinomonas sp.]|jgi:DNA-binding MarR family transcriptional regulator|uniref:MarR family winged helix-turn-helix transcriptional regulator n=1 Tax=Marinomonas TaxID=28253 RepID=UPI002243DD71|nr:MarR family transcriptional regulator [Marinomonas pontica]MCW8355804.1 MarR family transcriptional regulator [Marinomonas pontica]